MSDGSEHAVRAFGPADAEAVAGLCEEMQAHYGADCPPRATIVADLLDLPAGVRLLVAEGRGGIVGLAFLSPLFPGPGMRKGLFLKDLYVSASARGQGVGRALMAACAAVAVEEGYGRIDWTAMAGDSRLMAFYRDVGAVPDPKRAFLRLSGEGPVPAGGAMTGTGRAASGRGARSSRAAARLSRMVWARPHHPADLARNREAGSRGATHATLLRPPALRG